MKSGFSQKLKRVFAKDGFLLVLYWFLYKTHLSVFLSDLVWTKLQYRVNVGKPLNLSNPVSYNEKLQWLKLYDHRPIYTVFVDKLLVKDYVRSIIGDEYIIPTLAFWHNEDEIDFDSLPNQFVLKTNHSGGNSGIVICKDKSHFDLNKAKQKLSSSLKHDSYAISREWPYKNVKRCILAEKYMEDSFTSELRDYKFFCFDGEPKALFVASGRQERSEPYFDFFDMEYNHLDLKCPHPNAPMIPDKPVSFEEMVSIARMLSKGFPHLRVDLYEINGRPYFGELTLYHWEGLMPFNPEQWNLTFGSWLSLPKRTNEE